MRAEVAEKGDAGLVAENSRSTQRLVLPPPPLSAAGVFAKFQDIARLSGTAVSAAPGPQKPEAPGGDKAAPGPRDPLGAVPASCLRRGVVPFLLSSHLPGPQLVGYSRVAG